MGQKWIDIPLYLGWVSNACKVYGINCVLERTKKGVPYLQVGEEGKVRIVIFPRTHKCRVFYMVERTGEQEHIDCAISEDRVWVTQLAALASGMAWAWKKPENS